MVVINSSWKVFIQSSNIIWILITCRPFSTKTYRERSQTVHQGVCNMSHMQVRWILFFLNRVIFVNCFWERMRSVNINFNENVVEYFGQKDNKTVISQKMRQDGKSLRKYNAFNFVNFALFSEIWPFFSFTYF